MQFYPAQLVLLALGFLGPQQQCLKPLGVETDPRTNIKTAANVRHFSDSAILRGLTYNVMIRATLRMFPVSLQLVIVTEASPSLSGVSGKADRLPLKSTPISWARPTLRGRVVWRRGSTSYRRFPSLSTGWTTRPAIWRRALGGSSPPR